MAQQPMVMGSQEARDLIANRVESCQGLVRTLAWQISRRLPRHVDEEELVAYGQLGLVEAASRYDATQGAKFITYAYYRIRGSILDAVARAPWFRIEDYHSGLYEQDRKEDDADEAAASAVGGGKGLGSRATTCPVQRDHNSQPTAAQITASSELRMCVRQVLDGLPADEMRLMQLVYYDGASLADAGRQLGMSRSWACRMHQQLLLKIAVELEGFRPR